jgi:hypothetical protein
MSVSTDDICIRVYLNPDNNIVVSNKDQDEFVVIPPCDVEALIKALRQVARWSDA